MPSLVLIMEGFERYVYPLGKATLLVGRQGEADIQLPDSTISHNHASIVLDHGEFILRDNGSSNGSYVNGQKVNRCKLDHLDLVRFGNYLFLVNFHDDTKAGKSRRMSQKIKVDLPSSESVTKSLPKNASQGLSLTLTKPVPIKKKGKTHVNMMLDTL